MGRQESTSAVPAPLSEAHLRRVPGVLGKICLERYADHVGEGRGAQALRVEHTTPAFDNSLRRKPLGRPSGASPLAVIAEVKRASPSQGAIADLDPVEASRAYTRGGAAALSVLTEPRHFGGDLEALTAVVRDQTAGERPLPVLRKDFTVHPRQVVEAREAGASAVLLIVAVMGERLAEYLSYVEDTGLQALVEVHDEGELDLALAAGARIIGVNNRDLVTLKTDLSLSPRLLRRARDAGHTGVLVAESGYRTRADLLAVEGLADAVLVGTSLAGAGDLERALLNLVSPNA